MELILQNFRGIQNKILSFESGIHLLDGESGVGKSTCLEALQWVLYGGSNIYPFDYDKKTKEFTKVKLKINNLMIQRIKPPDKVSIIINQETQLEFTEAQKYIDNYFGSKTFWESSYYLKQDCRNLLLFGTKEEKNNIVKEIVFGTENGDNTPDKYLEKTNTYLKNLETEIFGKQKVIDYLTNNIEDKNINLTDKEIKICKKILPKKQEIQNKLDIIKHKILEQEENKKKKLRKIQISMELKDYPKLTLTFMEKWKKWLHATEELKKYSKDNLNLPQIDLEVLKKEIYDLERKKKIYYPNLKKLKSFNNKIPYSKKFVNEEVKRLEKQKIDVIKYNNYLEKKNSIIKISEKIKFFNKKLESFKSPLQELGNIEDLDEIKEKLMELKTNLIECPKCKTKLILTEGKLKLGTGTLVSKKELEKYTIEYKKLQEYHKIKTERDSLRKVYSEMKLPIPVEEVLGNESEIEIKINKLKEIEIVDFEEEVYQEKRKLYQETLIYQRYNDLNKEIDNNYLEEMEKLNVPKDLNKYYQEYESLNQELKLLKSQIFEDEDKDLEIKKSKAELLLLDIEKYEQYLQLQKEKERLDLLNKEVNGLIKKTEYCYKIRKIIQEESNVTFENLMISFNNILNDIVSEIFEDIYIEIGMFKKMKSKGDIKPQFNMKIVLKGNEYDNLNFLSGGEKDRISMALMITLAKLGRGNIVMLDETMSSLDEAMRQEMLLLIKKHLQDKTVLVVCHSTVEGFYDTITRF